MIDLTDSKAKEIVKELRISYGVITSPEAVKEFNLGLGLMGEYPNSKRELIQKFLADVHSEISVPTTDLYKKYMSSVPKLKKHPIPNFMKF